MDEKSKKESLSELEQIEGNYYKMDFFVTFSLVVFSIYTGVFTEENVGWAVFLGILAVLFCLRGISNWRRKRRREGEVNRTCRYYFKFAK